IFSGKSWVDGSGNAVPMANTVVTDVKAILDSHYLDALKQYGSDGKALFATTDYFVDGTPTATNAMGLPDDTVEIPRILNRTPSPFPYPGGGSVLNSPIYIVLRDVNAGAGSNHASGVFTPAQGPQAGASLPYNWIDIAEGLSRDGIDDIFSH